ncbi:MAG: PhoH family protein [Synergistales bacterium]|nr:PhoH family protein [Synergistales bacterium]
MRILGQNDSNLRLIEERYPVQIVARGETITIQGPDRHAVAIVGRLIQEVKTVAQRGHRITASELRYGMDTLAQGEALDLASLHEEIICFTTRGKPVRPQTAGQQRYLQAIRANHVVFCIGPAGTGKTYLAVAMAVAALKEKMISRIILVRPAVEAGESLGYLPGDLKEKIEPYLRPLYDAFYDLLTPERFMRYVDKNVIEIAPLAYMRGRTLNDSFIILDEAQNTTPEQMKMFLTRMGFGSQVVVTGDITQVDLPSGKGSGLEIVHKILYGLEGIAFTSLDKEDVVRHEIVQRIVQAYENFER